MGNFVLDTWVLKLARVSQELWIIQNYFSDPFVPHLASVKTTEK